MIAVAVGIILLGVVWLFWRRLNIFPPTPDKQRQVDSQTQLASGSNVESPDGLVAPTAPGASQEVRLPNESAIQRILAAYQAPISFNGRVVDERAGPIAGALVRFDIADKPLGEASVLTRITDGAGEFSLGGVRGASVSVWVTKPGYYSTSESKGRFVYGGVGGRQRENPTPQAPAIFILRKMGETTPLFVIDRDILIPKDGVPVEISLRSGDVTGVGRGDIVIEAWTSDKDIDANRNEHFDWRLRLTVPNGGLADRQGRFTFEAPESGYSSQAEVNMPKDSSEWRATVQREYFVKTRTGCFARINIRMTAQGSHFVTIRGYFNPAPGVRNLEFDANSEAHDPDKVR